MNDKKKKFENIYEQISFPKDWEPTSLSDVFDLRRETMVPTGIGNQRYIGLEHIDSGRMKISRYGVESEIRSAKNKFYPDDILYGKLRPYLDKSVLADIEGICSTDILVFKVDKERILPRYGACLVHTSAFLQYVISTTTGVNHPRTSWSSIGKFRCSIPKLAEQSIIVHALFILQQAIEHQEKIIEKTKELKRSLMQRLFTYGLRGEELKETEIGLMPENWEIVEVGELGEIITGTTPPTKNKEYYTGGSYQFISPFDLGNTKYAYKTEKEISSKGLSVSRCLPKDAVLVVCIGSTIGKVGMTSKDKSATNQQINTIVCDKKYNPHFVYYCLLFKSEYIRSLATPSPVPIMSKGKFQKAVISIPANRDEQDKIVEILSAIDEKVEKAQSRKHALQALFRSMLNLLMTGQVRVKDIDFGEACE